MPGLQLNLNLQERRVLARFIRGRLRPLTISQHRWWEFQNADTDYISIDELAEICDVISYRILDDLKFSKAASNLKLYMQLKAPAKRGGAH